jgi:DNA helicase-2/ATP-dependent DNA helicase PcrA
MKLDLNDLNEVQQQAVKTTNKHVLILAGAGSGKTRTLTYRIAYLIQGKKVKPENILAVTFTNKAAKEMRSRLDTLLKSDLSKLWIGTFHAMCARILRTETKASGLDKSFTIYDSEDQVGVVKRVMSTLNIPQQLYSAKLFQNRISRAKNKLIYPQDMSVSSPDELESLLPEVYDVYQRLLHENNAVDFDDLLLLPIMLFNKHPNVLEKYQKKFRYIFIDEYQDTNKAQYTLVRQLTGTQNALCVVGDEDQSIYRWRGADINNILNFKKDFKQAEVFRLEENYRSNKTILAGANAMVANNTQRLGKNLWTRRKEGSSIVVIDAEDEIDEAKKVVENIHNEMFNRKMGFKDIAILYRTNAQSRALEDELRKNAISYSIVGGVRFYERKEIKDILAYLKVIANPYDSISLKRIINFPLRGIGDTTVNKIEKYASGLGISLLEGLNRVKEVGSISSGMANRVTEFDELIKKYQVLSKELPPAELTSALAHETGIIEYLKNEYDQYESESRLENVYELFNTIDIFSTEFRGEDKANVLPEFLENIALLSDIDSMEDDNNAVTLMTLHSSKGLEFPVVFISGLEMGLFPLQRNSADEMELEEERRLFYVGMTRAEDSLYLSYARRRRRYSSNSTSMPSLFLDEIPAEFITLRVSQRSTGLHSASSRKQARRKKMLEYFNEESDSQEAGPVYKVGSMVYHETFGKGKIVALEGQGNKMKISVSFEGNVRKKLIAQYANLTPLELNE